MWKHIHTEEVQKETEAKKHKRKTDDFGSNNGYHFTIDCSNSHKGLFAGKFFMNTLYVFYKLIYK